MVGRSIGLIILVSMNLEMLIEDSPVGVKLGALVALKPGLGHLVSVLGVGVVVKMFQIFILKKNWPAFFSKLSLIDALSQ